MKELLASLLHAHGFLAKVQQEFPHGLKEGADLMISGSTDSDKMLDLDWDWMRHDGEQMMLGLSFDAEGVGHYAFRSPVEYGRASDKGLWDKMQPFLAQFYKEQS